MSVVEFNGMTKLNLDAARCLRNIADDLLPEDKVIVIVVNDDHTTFHSSVSNRYEIVYNLEYMKHQLLNGDLG